MAQKYLLEINRQLHLGAPCSIAEPFQEWGIPDTDIDRLRHAPESIAAVFFAGGSDVAPSLYGERIGSRTGPIDTARDTLEQELFTLARLAGLPMIGVCRGSQFLCVMAGGRLGQHIEGHSRGHEGTHPVRALEIDNSWVTLEATSSHHQAVLPPPDAEVLAWAEPPRAGGRYLNGEDAVVPLPVEVEAVYYPALRAIGFLWHPEWLPAAHPCVAYSRRIAAARLKI